MRLVVSIKKHVGNDGCDSMKSKALVFTRPSQTNAARWIPRDIAGGAVARFPRGSRADPDTGSAGSRDRDRVWIPNPYSNRAMLAWPHLRGVRLVLSMLAGTEWIPPLVGPHVTICNARGAHNISTAEWTLAAILAMLKYFPMYLRHSARGPMEAPLRGSEALCRDHRRQAPLVSARDAGGVDRQEGAAGGLWRHRQGD